MLAKLTAAVLRQRIAVLFLTACLAAVGWRALENLPIEAFPDVQDVQVQVVTQMPGQAAEEIERVLTLPIERELSGVPRQTQLRSVSIGGLSVVTLTFEDGTDDYFARQQVGERLQNVTLPPGVQPSLAPLSTAVGEVFRYVVEAPAGMDENEVRALQDWTLRPALRQVPGVADVVSFGGTVKEYQVQLDPLLLNRYGVTLDQVRQALGNASANAGGGLVRRGDEALVVRGIGIFERIDDIGRTVVSASNGRTVLVADVGQVAIGHSPRSGVVAFNRRDSVVEGIVQMSKGADAAKVVADVKEAAARLGARLPPGVRIHTIYDRSDLIGHTVRTVAENLVTGALLVIAILVVFLGNWRAALIVAAVIPLSLLCAFIVLDARGIPANLISLGAVDFGIIIDSAVVLVEALLVRLHLQARTDAATPDETVTRTVAGLGKPILFAKAVIVVAFIPIYTFQRVEGKIFAPVAFTLSFAMLGALLLTMTLVPVLLAWADGARPLRERPSAWLGRLQDGYRRLLLRAWSRRPLVFALSGALLALTLGLAPLLGSEFLPRLDEGNLWLTIELPVSSSIETTRAIEAHVRAILQSYPEVGNIVSHVGRPDDGTDPKGPNNMEILADLAPHSGWRFADKDALVADISRRIHMLPGVPTNFSQVIEDNVEEALSGVKGEIAVKLYGPDMAVLERKAEQVAGILRGIRGAADVEAVRIGGQSELDVRIDRERIARLGLNVADVNAAIQAALGGIAVGQYYEGDRRFDLTLRLREQDRASLDGIGALQIALPGGAGNNAGSVRLADVATIGTRQGASRISREGGERNASVKANLLGRDQGSFVAEAQQKVAAQVALPPGYRITWGGQFENQQRAVKRLRVIVPLTAFLIFALLFGAFRSARRALLVLAIVPFTLVGALAGLGLADLHFSISAAVGLIAVAGIAVQNGVIMVEQIVELQRAGGAPLTSALEGAAVRLRPILMTALMAGLGLLPAAMSHGIGSETQRPFAVVIVGGVVSATVFTLLLLPLAYPWFAGGAGLADGRRADQAEPAEAASVDATS